MTEITISMEDTPSDTPEGADDPICFSMSSTDEELSSLKERDEVKEIQKMTHTDTARVNRWRVAATVVLLLTAVAVTATTYSILKKEEAGNFDTGYAQFSRTVAEAARGQMKDLLDALTATKTLFEAHADGSGQQWPLVSLPHFQRHAMNMAEMGHAECVALFYLVNDDQMEPWIDFTNRTHRDWVTEGHLTQKGNLDRFVDGDESYFPFVTTKGPNGTVPQERKDVYAPSYYFSPPPKGYSMINWDLLSVPVYDNIFQALLKLRNETLITEVKPYTVAASMAFTQEEHEAMHSDLADSKSEHPHSMAFQAIHKNVGDSDSETVALVSLAFAWDAALQHLLPEGVEGIHSIIKNNCGQAFSYEINGADAIFVGEGDLHETKFDDREVVANLALHSHPEFATTSGHCQFSMHIYPTSKFKDSFDDNTPEIFAAAVAITFVLVAVVFYLYDLFVQRRNENLTIKAAQTNAIVANLFPDTIRDRLIEQKNEAKQNKKSGNLKAFLNDGKNGAIVNNLQTQPLADLFLETTVLFADVVGFTAWSSVREPSSVFHLLETLYQAFDIIAKKRRIFKVETVGDCYVAVAGLPEPRKDHAVGMARFARDIVATMRVLTKDLEVSLGPDTGDLDLRVGVHSGPVTAGVLRSERARFQLFGDTMNTCARLESSSKRGHIHASKETADLLVKAGRGKWLRKREDRVSAKGKGELETYYILLEGGAGGSVVSGSSYASTEYAVHNTSDSRTERLIGWNTEILLRLLKQVVARTTGSRRSKHGESQASGAQVVIDVDEMPLSEVKEIIELPEFDAKSGRRQQSPEEIEIPQKVQDQLQNLVSSVASLYNQNPFHNFDHASHVVMSVIKLMSRIVAPSHILDAEELSGDQAALLHDHTFGITSDPLTQFACVSSALIHDVDHVGVPNAQLVNEKVPIAEKYGRSVAEQNSLCLSWDLLMKPEYSDLRSLLLPTKKDLARFRSLVVNSVMATDIADPQLKDLRNGRWETAFHGPKGSVRNLDCNARDAVNRKATIVIEHLIQASDVSHTMQHWHVYRKWNMHLYEELYVAHRNGRALKDPAEFWYKGEICFFDYYIIPLTKKLKECGVFGVSSGEYLNYALKNREEWELRGQDVVAGMIEEMKKKYGDVVKPE